jgi:LPS export ABC transporter protein LptC
MAKKASMVLIIGIVVFSTGALTVSHIFRPKPPEVPEPKPTTITDKNEGMRLEKIQYSSTGDHPFHLKAVSAAIDDALENISVRDPKINYKLDQGDVFVTAKSCKLNKKVGDYIAEGDVVVRFGDFVFQTQDIEYADRKRLIETSKTITLKGPNISLEATGMKLDVDKKQIVLEGNVSATLSNANIRIPGKKLPL